MLKNRGEFNETLDYLSEQIRRKGFFVADDNTKLKKLSQKDNKGNKYLWLMHQAKLLKYFNKRFVVRLLLIHIGLVSAVARTASASTLVAGGLGYCCWHRS